MSDPASPVQADCARFQRLVDVVCFQELSKFWRQFVSKECFEVGWTTHIDETMNVLTAIRTSAVGNVTADAIDCFPDPLDKKNRHRGWRRALETVFLCRVSGRQMSVVNLHIISGTHHSNHKSSRIPGETKAQRLKFKSQALMNTVRQANERLAKKVGQDERGVLIVTGDMNLDTLAVQAVLLEFASFTNQALVGMNLGGPSGRDWIVSNAAAMEAISMDVTPVDAMHVVVAARFTNALGEIAPIPPFIGGFGECFFIASLKEHHRKQAKLAEDQHRREEQNDPTTRVEGEVLPQPAIVTEQCTAPPTPVQPTAFDLRSPTSPAEDDEGETHVRQTLLELGRLAFAVCLDEMTTVQLTHWCRLTLGHPACSAPLLPEELEVVQARLAAARQAQAVLPPMPALILPSMNLCWQDEMVAREEMVQEEMVDTEEMMVDKMVPSPLSFPQLPTMPGQAPDPTTVDVDRYLWRAVLPPATEQRAPASPKAAVKAAPNAAPLMDAPRLVAPNDTSRTPAPPAAAPPAAEKAAPTPPKAAPEAPSAADTAAAATSQRLAPTTAAAPAAAATSQRLLQSAPVAASSAAAPAAAQGTKTPRWGDIPVDLTDEDLNEVDRRPDAAVEEDRFEANGPRLSRVVTRKEAEWVMTEVVPVYAFEAFELALRSERPLLRIAALATFGRGGVQAGLVR